MTDRELLERAAQAAGYVLTWKTGHCKGGEFSGAFISGKDDAWNPLTDDGDALRLAVKLRLDICRPDEAYDAVCVWVDHLCDFIEEPHGKDANAATRRAIVRAAAEIGGLT